MSSKDKSKVPSKVSKLMEKIDPETENNEHELSFYINDRVVLMKEVLKIIKPKKIKSMAPNCIKDLDIEEINSMLLEELLGISNKRLKYIFGGQNLEEDSSSTDPEEEKQPIDIISLDDVSDDDFVTEVNPGQSKSKQGRVKKEGRVKKIKKEKPDKKNKKDGPLEEENLMSVLELLELQARARAIRSQLMLEANKKTSQIPEVKIDSNSDSDNNSVIIEIPKSEEIVIDSSNSENEEKESDNTEVPKTSRKNKSRNVEGPQKKIVLIRDRFDKPKRVEPSSPAKGEDKTNEPANEENKESSSISNEANSQSDKAKETLDESNVQDVESVNDDDEIVLIVDHEEMEGIIGD